MQFRPEQGAKGAAALNEHVSRFQVSEQIRSGKVTLRDWNFEKPALLLNSEAEGASSAIDTSLEVYDYPGEYVAPADGDALSKLRLDELLASRSIATGASRCTRFRPGYSFTLSEYPRDSFNASYLLTRVEYWGTAPNARQAGEEGETTVYGNSFEVIPAAVVFRPFRVTRRPQIHGVQTAIVVGPAGEEIYTDQYGRVKVQFHWDRLGKKDDKSSCWVRVAQIWASAGFGGMFLPRINDEVVVTFLEGDPDRPLIVGASTTAPTSSPYSLPEREDEEHHQVQHVARRRRLERAALRGQEGLRGGVPPRPEGLDHRRRERQEPDGRPRRDAEVGNDRTKTVKHDQTATVEHDDTFTVKNDQTGTVEHDQSLTVKNNRSVTVQADHTETVQGNQSVSITKAQTVTISDKQEISVDKTRSLTVTGDVTETFKAKLTLSVTGDVSESLSAKRTVSVSGDDSETIGGKQAVTISGDATESVSGKKSMTVTGNVTITSGSSTVTIKPSGEITISGVQITIDASGPLKLHGATVDIEVRRSDDGEGAGRQRQCRRDEHRQGRDGGPRRSDGERGLSAEPFRLRLAPPRAVS